MRLEVISDYGATTTEISNRATPELIKETMASLDWQRFHQVVLSKPNGDWIEVGGSINPDEGLSVMWEEAGAQEVIAPASVAEMTGFLLGFLSENNEWRNARTTRTAEADASQLSPPHPTRRGLAPKILGLGFVGLLLVAALFLLRETYFGVVSEYWPTAPGTIDHSSIAEHYGTDADDNETVSYFAEVRYSYSVDHRYYEGDRVSFGGKSSSDSEDLIARSISTKYPVGRPVSVRYDPTHPQRAVLEPGVNLGLVLLHIVFWGIGGGVLFKLVQRRWLQKPITVGAKADDPTAGT